MRRKINAKRIEEHMKQTLFAFWSVAILLAVGCSESFSPLLVKDRVIESRNMIQEVRANGWIDVNGAVYPTSYIIISFSADHYCDYYDAEKLAEDDFILDSNDEANKHIVKGKIEKVYYNDVFFRGVLRLPISNIGKSGNITIQRGTGPKFTVYVYEVTNFESIRAEGNPTNKFVLKFDKDIYGLSLEDIELTGSADIVKAKLERVNTGIYNLFVSNNVHEDSVKVSVKIKNHSVSPTALTVPVVKVNELWLMDFGVQVNFDWDDCNLYLVFNHKNPWTEDNAEVFLEDTENTGIEYTTLYDTKAMDTSEESNGRPQVLVP